MRAIHCLAAAVLLSSSLACTTTSSSTPQPQPGGSDVVMDSLKTTEATADARVKAHVRAADAVKQTYEAPLAALSKRAEGAGADIAGAQAAMRALAEAGKVTRADAETFNAKYAVPARRALDEATGTPGLSTLLAATGTTPQFDTGDLPVPLGGPAPSCCRTVTLPPPWQGLYSESDFGARAISPDPVSMLTPAFTGAALYAPHRLQRSGRSFTVDALTTTVRVDVTLDTSWNVAVSAVFAFAHAWLGLDMDVTAPGGRLLCRAPHLEQENRQIVVGSNVGDGLPGPRVVRSCEFTRSPTDPTTFSANATAAADGTFVGSGFGSADYRVTLGTVTVTTCP